MQGFCKYHIYYLRVINVK